MTGFFERVPGNRSMMRLLAFLGFCLGGLVAVWGLVLLTIAIMRVLNGQGAAGMVGNIILLIGSGLGLAGGGEVLKVVQQRSESKDETQTSGTVEVGK